MGLTSLVAKVQCSNCPHEWGIVFKYGSVFLPGLKCDAFVVVSMGKTGNAETDRQTFNKWAAVENSKFVVDPITAKDKVIGLSK